MPEPLDDAELADLMRWMIDNRVCIYRDRYGDYVARCDDKLPSVSVPSKEIHNDSERWLAVVNRLRERIEPPGNAVQGPETTVQFDTTLLEG